MMFNSVFNFHSIDSSNMNPQEFWNYGIQMVSLNYQTLGLMMDLQVCFHLLEIKSLFVKQITHICM